MQLVELELNYEKEVKFMGKIYCTVKAHYRKKKGKGKVLIKCHRRKMPK